MIRHPVKKAAVILAVLCSTVHAQPTAESLKRAVAQNRSDLSTMRGEFTARFSVATSQGMRLHEELTGMFAVKGDKECLNYISGERKAVRCYDGRISTHLYTDESGGNPKALQWIGARTLAAAVYELTPRDFTTTLKGDSLTRFEYVDSAGSSDLIGYTSPRVGFSSIYRIQVQTQEGDRVIALAIAPDPSAHGYSILVFDASKSMAMLEKRIYTTRDALVEEMLASDYQCVGDAWLPGKIVETRYRTDGDRAKRQRSLEITYRNFEIPVDIPDLVFRPSLPSGTRVKDLSAGFSYVVGGP